MKTLCRKSPKDLGKKFPPPFTFLINFKYIPTIKHMGKTIMYKKEYSK